MRLGIFSDIHGNLEAFRAVLESMGRRELDRIVCLGDMVGYGPDPEKVIQGVRALQCDTVLGNHEASLLTEKARNWMNFEARENSIRTAQLISKASLEFCRALPGSLQIGDALFVHGYPPDSVFAYLFNQSDRRIEELFASPAASLYFVGHTHELQLVRQQAGKIIRVPLFEGTVSLDRDLKYIVNAGSVGQPRDGDKRAKYVIWDSETRNLETVFVAYDCRDTIRKIHELGFPEIYAERLR